MTSGTATPGRRAQRLAVVGQPAVVARDRLARDGVQPHRADVVAERVPELAHLVDIGGGERAQRRVGPQELAIFRDHPLHLRLLEHDLGNEHAVGHALAAPRQVAAVARVPGEQATLEAAHGGLRRGHAGQSRTRRAPWTACPTTTPSPSITPRATPSASPTAPTSAWSR